MFEFEYLTPLWLDLITSPVPLYQINCFIFYLSMTFSVVLHSNNNNNKMKTLFSRINSLFNSLRLRSNQNYLKKIYINIWTSETLRISGTSCIVFFRIKWFKNFLIESGFSKIYIKSDRLYFPFASLNHFWSTIKTLSDRWDV